MGALNASAAGGWARRARPLLGTLVEVGLPLAAPAGGATHEAAFAAVWALLQDLQAQLSLFDPGSDLSRLHAAPPGTRLSVRPHTARVLTAACHWATLSDGAFDLAQGSGPGTGTAPGCGASTPAPAWTPAAWPRATPSTRPWPGCRPRAGPPAG